MTHGSSSELMSSSAMTSCPLGVPLKKNDKFWLAANYDFNKHEG
jgi:hypothetical protein